MKIGVLDIGSNSVRALVSADGKLLFRGLITTRLGEGLGTGNRLKEEAVARTVTAVDELYKKCLSHGAERICPFATEAVRSADNGGDFVSAVKACCGLDVDVISGEEEAEIGLLGALEGKDGAIIDIGGGSTEISVAENKKLIYSKSLPLGAVRLFDACGEDRDKLEKIISEKIKGFGKIPPVPCFTAIGGTATALAAVDLGLVKYDMSKIQGHYITKENLVKLNKKIFRSTVEERINELHITPKRSEIIAGGAYLLLKLVCYLKTEGIKVSESDNMEGYIRKKILGESYEKQV